MENLKDYAARVALPIKDMRLLNRALTHRSFLNENPQALEDNERLEFLGDAVLDFVVGSWLYNHFPEMSEGEMTRLRSALVRTEQLSVFAEQLDMGHMLRLGRGEEEGGGRKRPAMLCAAFEALIGALYLDAGIAAVEEYISSMLVAAVDEIYSENRDRDPKSLLQEWVQGKGLAAPRYRIISESGPDHDKHFTVQVEVDGQPLADGEGRNKQAASKMAAKIGLSKLKAQQSKEITSN